MKKKTLFMVVLWDTESESTSVGLVLASKEPSAKVACKALGFDFNPFSHLVRVFKATPKDAVEI